MRIRMSREDVEKMLRENEEMGDDKSDHMSKIRYKYFDENWNPVRGVNFDNFLGDCLRVPKEGKWWHLQMDDDLLLQTKGETRAPNSFLYLLLIGLCIFVLGVIVFAWSEWVQ